MEKENVTIAPEMAMSIMANCADDGNKYWFPMRVSYGRAAQVAGKLKEKDYCVEFFLPTEERTVFFEGRMGYYMLTNKEMKHKKKADGTPVERKVKIRKLDCLLVGNAKNDNPIADTGEGEGVNKGKGVKGDESMQVDIPLINSLIFLYGKRSDINELKSSFEPFTFLRYMTFTNKSEVVLTGSKLEMWASRRIRVIPKIQMEQFMNVLNEEKNHVTLVPYDSFEKYVGKRIRFIDGPFKGQEAVIRREGKKQNKRFLFDLGNIVVARVDYIPKQQYEIIQ